MVEYNINRNFRLSKWEKYVIESSTIEINDDGTMTFTDKDLKKMIAYLKKEWKKKNL